MRHRKLHPVTADMRRELSVATLAKAGGFRQPMRFPLWGIETARDHIRIFSVRDRKRPPEIIAIDWRQMTFGAKPFFGCPRCRTRRIYLYHDGLFCFVAYALVFGIGVSASIGERGYCTGHTSCRYLPRLRDELGRTAKILSI